MRVAAAIVQADVREHRIACFELRDLASNFFNHARDVATENDRERATSVLGEQPRPDHAINWIHAGCYDPDEQLIVLGFWSRDILVL